MKAQTPSESLKYLPELEHFVPPSTRVLPPLYKLNSEPTPVRIREEWYCCDSFLCAKHQMPAGRTGGTRPSQTPGKRLKHVPRTASGSTAGRKRDVSGTERLVLKPAFHICHIFSSRCSLIWEGEMLVRLRFPILGTKTLTVYFSNVAVTWGEFFMECHFQHKYCFTVLTQWN